MGTHTSGIGPVEAGTNLCRSIRCHSTTEQSPETSDSCRVAQQVFVLASAISKTRSQSLVALAMPAAS